ncbi:MAG: serine/threonine protein kinase [Alphaproteobacteria bacterium]|nr:serine/threonine protein kinase [Alphaproteobacteria bacterium]
MSEEEATDPALGKKRDAGSGEPERVAGRYVVDRLIARGGMASVFKAEQVDLGRPVALKILRPPEPPASTAAFEERFRDEARALAALSHPHIVAVHDFGQTDDGRCFLAMDYIEGKRLSDLLRDGPLPPRRAILLMLQVCGALQYAHQRGVVHRDLKPSNLIVQTGADGTDQVTVVDFGLAKVGGGDTPKRSKAKGKGKHKGKGDAADAEETIQGSPHCMAPEQVKGWDGDARSDVYAIGVLLHRCISGRYPFHGDSPQATLLLHLNEAVPSLSDHVAGAYPDVVVPDGLDAIVARCLAKQPKDRFPDMAMLVATLAPLVGVSPEDYLRGTTLTPADAPTESNEIDDGEPSEALAAVRAAPPVAPGAAAAKGKGKGKGKAAAPKAQAAAKDPPAAPPPPPPATTADRPRPSVALIAALAVGLIGAGVVAGRGAAGMVTSGSERGPVASAATPPPKPPAPTPPARPTPPPASAPPPAAVEAEATPPTPPEPAAVAPPAAPPPQAEPPPAPKPAPAPPPKVEPVPPPKAAPPPKPKAAEPAPVAVNTPAPKAKVIVPTGTSSSGSGSTASSEPSEPPAPLPPPGPSTLKPPPTDGSWAEQRADAFQAYNAGLTAARNGAWAQARGSFFTAQDLLPHPATAFNIALTYEAQGEIRKALHWYRVYGDGSPARAREVSARVRSLEAQALSGG